VNRKGSPATEHHEADELRGGSAEPVWREVVGRELREASQPHERRASRSDAASPVQDIPKRSEEGDGCFP